MKQVIEHPDGTVYVMETFISKRGIGKNAEELIVWGFNKYLHPDTYKEVIKGLKVIERINK